MEGQEACGEVDGMLECHETLSSAFLLDHVGESRKWKGLLLGDAATAMASASAAADIAVAAPGDIAPYEKNNVQPIWKDEARPFKDRDVAWILARQNSRKRNMELRSVDFSAFGPVELFSSEGIQSLLVEGARTGAIFGPAEKRRTAEERSFDETGCSTEMTTNTPGCDPSNPEVAADGKMDPLTPEIVQQTCRGTSPGSSAGYTSPPETTDAGNFLSNDRGAPLRAPAMANGASAMLTKGTSCLNVPPSRGAQPRTQERATKQEVPAIPSVTDKSTRKRKYQPKIRAENPRPRSRAKRESVFAVNASLRAEIPETTSSPSLVQMKSLARINQRGPRLKRLRRGKVAEAAISEESPANAAPGCSLPPRPTADPAYQDAITQSADFLRCLHECLFSDQATELCPADRANSSCNGSLCTRSSHLGEEEVDADCSPAEKDPPSTPRVPVPRVSTCRATRESVDAVNASLRAEIPETTSSPSLTQMKSLARNNQRGPRLKRLRRGKVAAAAISEESPANDAPGCSLPPRPTADPAYQDAITQSADFLRCLHECLFSDQATKLCPADRADSSCNGSLCTRSSRLGEEEVDVDCSLAEKDPPSTPRGVPVPLVSTCRDFTLLRSPWSPPSPHGASDVFDPWSNFDDITNSQDHFSAKSVRRALQFDAAQLQEDHAHLCQVSSQALAAAPDIDLLQVPEEELYVPQVVNLDPGSPGRENELQVVAYDEGSKRLVVYQQRVPRVRRVRYKPKVNLDARTVRMFKTLTIKAAGVGEGEEAAEDEKTAWERSRQVWQHRAHHFISIMRQVQGNRSFSRWKGSVVDSIGGAFLTQNVSDFLSSNAFISLRARFPARARETNTAETAPKAESAAEKVEKQRSITTDPSLPRPAESPTPRKKDHQRREEGWNEPCRSGENFAGESSPSRHEAAAQGPEISTAAQNTTECAPHHDMTSEEMAGEKNSNPQTALITAALEFEASTTLHHPNQQNVPSSDAQFFGLTSHCINSSPQQDMVVVVQPKCLHSVAADGELDHCETKSHQQSSNSPWKGKRAAPGVLQKKFASGVAAERIRVSSLTPVGQEENVNLVLSTTLTLQLVLGMKPATQEQLLRRLRDRLHKHEKKAAVSRNPKQQLLLQLRPGRALLRSSTNNYRYRRSVSFKLLAGEARASWEAGFVMKSQKAKWGPRRAAIVGDAHYHRDPWTADCVDWNAVHKASVHEVAEVIKNRGMNNALAGRMKAFLDRVHRDQDDGSIDLEWIRWLPPEEAKAFLLSFRGVGIKSVECIRLLTLHHPSFPVDTNVGRILVRLGWVPLEPLPEETQLHLLELYPIQSQIQQYAWPRLCTLDQKTLYELHYQMITFGKVFCTKSKPNCNACPMRTECKHYASSYASAKLLLKGGREEQEDQATAIVALRGTERATETIQIGALSGTPLPCIPIIEEPYSPEPNYTGDMSIPDIEELPVDFDIGAGVPVEIVNIGLLSSSETGSLVTEELCVHPDVVEKTRSSDLNREPEEETNGMPTTAVNLEKKGMDMTTIATMPNMNETRVAVEDDEVQGLQGGVPDDFKLLPSQELILLPPQPNMAPAPKLKNIQRLRTVHFVYELPDNHPLLFEMDKREDDDPCFYLLAIWSPDEVPATMPKLNDDESTNPFASCEEGCCNEDPEQTTVRGTLLIPCRTAMRGWFPLNGTYFQVNEVFADHASSVQPIAVPRTLLWSLRRRFVYFSTAVSNLFKDMSHDEIQCCFQKGYVCLRAFDVATRQPRILAPRLHQSGAKIVKAPTPRKGRQRKTPSSKSPPQTEMNHTAFRSDSQFGIEEAASQPTPQ